MNQNIQAYNNLQSDSYEDICEFLYTEIISHLPKAEHKVWHSHPVWFLEGNPIVGYAKRKDNVQLLFWSGQSFNEDDLQKEGSFKAAQVRYTSADQINATDLARWLKKTQEIQWDYKNIVKKRGVLERLK